MLVKNVFQEETVESDLTIQIFHDHIRIGIIPNLNDHIEPLTIILEKSEVEDLLR